MSRGAYRRRKDQMFDVGESACPPTAPTPTPPPWARRAVHDAYLTDDTQASRSFRLESENARAGHFHDSPQDRQLLPFRPPLARQASLGPRPFGAEVVQLNVLMIVSDTVRPDDLGINGGRVHTPNLDALARESGTSGARTPTRLTDFRRADYLDWDVRVCRSWVGSAPSGGGACTTVLAKNGVTTVGVVDTPSTGRRIQLRPRLRVLLRRGDAVPHDLAPEEEAVSRASRAVRGCPASKGDRTSRAPRALNNEYEYRAPQTMVTAEKALERLIDKRFFMLVDTWDPQSPGTRRTTTRRNTSRTMTDGSSSPCTGTTPTAVSARTISRPQSLAIPASSKWSTAGSGGCSNVSRAPGTRRRHGRHLRLRPRFLLRRARPAREDDR